MTVIWIPLFHRPPEPGLLASNCKIDQLQITRFQWFTPKRLTKRGWRSAVTRPKWHHKRDNRYQTWSSDCSPCEFLGAWHSQRKPPCLMFAPGSLNVVKAWWARAPRFLIQSFPIWKKLVRLARPQDGIPTISDLCLLTRLPLPWQKTDTKWRSADCHSFCFSA